MKSIAFIIPYFGHFPNYFDFWLSSCANNPTINWIIFSDCKDVHDYPSNVKLVNVTFEQLRERIQSRFDFPISLEKPFKFCDFRPAYGELFADYIGDYDFWGFCDVDLVWGDIRAFLTDEILDKYVKIGMYGHCCLIRNDERFNKMYRQCYPDIPNYRQVFSSKLAFCFDETRCFNEFFLRSGLSVYRLGCCFDVCTDYHCFLPATSHSSEDYKGISTAVFDYSEGKLVCHYNTNGETMKNTEVLYVHLQKRPMEILTLNKADYSIMPNKFVERITVWTYELINKKAPRRLFYPHFIKWRLRYYILKMLKIQEPKFFQYKVFRIKFKIIKVLIKWYF